MYRNIWTHGYDLGAKAFTEYERGSPSVNAITFRSQKRDAAAQALANKGYDLDMFERQLLAVSFDCAWSDSEHSDD